MPIQIISDLFIRKKRLKFPDYCEVMRLRNYLNFTLFTFNKIRILIQYLSHVRSNLERSHHNLHQPFF
ncbi:unnamed protein product [Rhizophagus irregularis]|nr:unnamed protein product [Rhizophagus irregularis]